MPLKIIKHPLIESKLTEMRQAEIDHRIFRENLREISSLMAFEVLKNYQTEPVKIRTALGIEMEGQKLSKEIVIIPILRAGLGMVEGIHQLIPQAKIGHIGLYREEIGDQVYVKEYFFKIPAVKKDSYIILVDPMIATGFSCVHAIEKLLKLGFKNIQLIGLVGVDAGLNLILEKFPEVNIFLSAKDLRLNEKNYIEPGLGDAGDRIFGTK